VTTLISSTSACKRVYPLLSTLVLAAALSGCAVYPVSSDAGADGAITADVQSRLAEHADLEPLSVQTVNGVVYLNGTVTSSLERGEAEAAALETQHVERVVDSISVDNE
jgi:hypothetical protein